MSGVAAAVGLGTLGAAYIGSEGAKDAANISSRAAGEAGARTDAQFQQTRRDLEPFREVATGRITGSNFDEQRYNEELARYDQDVADLRGSFGRSNVAFQKEQEAIRNLGQRPQRSDFTTSTREGGALQELAGFGRSQVLEGDFIPASDIPQFQGGRGDIPQFRGGAGDIPEFTRRNLQADPGYQFRVAEQERGINRAAAVGGKVASGNRLEEILARGGDLASQEFGAAYNRNLTEFDIARQREQEKFGRNLTGFGLERERESDIYGRDLTQFGLDATREADIYGRGVQSFGRARGEETDYLNRLANLANIGQAAATSTGQFGAQSAAASGNAAIAAGQAQAAGRIGQATAIQQGIGDITSLATRYNPGPRYSLGSVTTDYNSSFPDLPGTL